MPIAAGSTPGNRKRENEIKKGGRVFTYKDTAIIRPNSDTPYSFAGLALRAEPAGGTSRRRHLESPCLGFMS